MSVIACDEDTMTTEATGALRWKGGVLQQEWAVLEMCRGVQRRRLEWRDVPHDDG